MREIDQRFICDLKSESLSFFLEQVKKNRKELCLEIRDKYINIYYRGGNLLRIKQMKNGYRFHFDARYCLHKNDRINYDLLKSLDAVCTQDYIDNFGLMMSEMDVWLSEHPKPEREFQHKLLAQNSSIIDIEYAPPKSKTTGTKLNMRLDMLMADSDRLIIVENKFGIGAISGDAGVEKHYNDICKLLNNDEIYEELAESVLRISRVKYELGLINTYVKSIDKSKTQILILLADFNEKSEALKKQLSKINITYPISLLKMNSCDPVIDLSKIEQIN